jgi:hypothetical protein
MFFLLFAASSALAATGCDLNDPARDVPRLFPESTSFKTSYLSFSQFGGDPFLKKIEARLGVKYQQLYAPLNVPYTLYEIYNGKNKVGYIHGVNQKGQYGGLQVFVSLDLHGRIKAFYLQKVTGQWGEKLRNAKFYRQFAGLSLRDFDTYDPVSGKGTGKLAEIRNPAPDAVTDFYGIMRGLKKNLVLMDEFVYAPERGKK